MKPYSVKFDTWIEGSKQRQGAEVELDDDKAKPYVDAGLLEPVKPAKQEKAANSKPAASV